MNTISGGIKLDTLPEVIESQPDLIIAGEGITGAKDKKAAATKIAELTKQGAVA